MQMKGKKERKGEENKGKSRADKYDMNKKNKIKDKVMKNRKKEEDQRTGEETRTGEKSLTEGKKRSHVC